jgi:hypothetical protein
MTRKIFCAVFAAVMVAGVALAQEQVGVAEENYAPQRVYIEIVGVGQLFSSKMKVSVDYGQASSWWDGYDRGMLVDENGKEIKFNSMIDAMNYMSALGWMFMQAYVVPNGNKDAIGGEVHWLLYKDVNDPSEITEGFMTKGKLNK